MPRASAAAEARAVGRAGGERVHQKRLDWASRSMPSRSASSDLRHMLGVLERRPGRSASSDLRHMLGVLERMPGELWRMPRGPARLSISRMPRELRIMPGRSASPHARPMPGVLERMPGELRIMPGRSSSSHARRMPRQIALGRDRAACPAQHGIAVDRFAREIVRFLKASPGALAATECQDVRRQPPSTFPNPAPPLIRTVVHV